MASVVQFERTPAKTIAKRRASTKPIDPKLKQFIDRVVVPILVQEFLAVSEQENQIAPDGDRVALCSASANVPKVSQ